MGVEGVLFYAFALLAVISAIAMVGFVRNIVAGAMSLVVTMISLAGIYVLLEAHLVAVIQIMVYAGAILVLFLFVIMLLNLRGGQMGAENQPLIKLAGAGIVIAATVKLASLLRGPPMPWPELPEGFGQAEHIGLTLYTDYLLAFEVAGVLLLAGIVGAVILAKKSLD